MEELLDPVKLYGNLHTTWDKIRADVLSHAFLFCAIFLLAKVSFPRLSLSALEPQQLMESPYFKLAKETNLLWLPPVAVVVAVIVYGVLVRSVGQMLVALLFTFFKPKIDVFTSEFVKVPDLVTVAATLDRSKWADFNEGDILQAMTDPFRQHSSTKNNSSRDRDLSIATTPKDKNAGLYLGHASFFVLGWLLIILLLPASSTWRLQNHRQLWLAGLFLLAFWVWSWLRQTVFFMKWWGELVTMVALEIRTAEDSKLQSYVNDDDFRQIETRLRQLRQRRNAKHPSLLRYVTARYFTKRTTNKPVPERHMSSLSRIYEVGKQFGSDQERNQSYDKTWLTSYASYVFYCLVRVMNPSSLFGYLLGLAVALIGLGDWAQFQVARLQRIAAESNPSLDNHSSMKP